MRALFLRYERSIRNVTHLLYIASIGFMFSDGHERNTIHFVIGVSLGLVATVIRIYGIAVKAHVSQNSTLQSPQETTFSQGTKCSN